MQAQIASYREYDQDPTDNDQCQKRVYMPANQYGSKRRARKNVNDGIELCNQFGKPDFFITLTANPLWADAANPELTIVTSIFQNHSLKQTASMIEVIRSTDERQMKIASWFHTIQTSHFFGKVS